MQTTPADSNRTSERVPVILELLHRGLLKLPPADGFCWPGLPETQPVAGGRCIRLEDMWTNWIIGAGRSNFLPRMDAAATGLCLEASRSRSLYAGVGVNGSSGLSAAMLQKLSRHHGRDEAGAHRYSCVDSEVRQK